MFLQPSSLSAAVDMLAQSGGRLLAGGTDYFPALGASAPSGPVIDISHLHELRSITTDERHVRIGAATTWSEIATAGLPPGFAALKAAAREIGSVQIQNRGTIAGNVCNASPAADGVPVLLVLDAEVELLSPDGCRILPLGDFITANRRTALRAGEIVTSILVPRHPAPMASVFAKLGARRYMVISIAMVAVALRLDDGGAIADIRMAVGACSAVAKRLPGAEAALLGERGGAALCVAHLAALSPVDDVRATAAYRLDATLTLLRRAVADCLGLAVKNRG